jgi:hypothetical protein
MMYEENKTGLVDKTDLETQLKHWEDEIELDRDRYDDVTEFITKFKDKAELQEREIIEDYVHKEEYAYLQS